MKIPLTVQMLLIAVGLTGFYMMVGQAVPQKEVQPPEVIELAADLSTAEMVEIGKEIFNGKGICVTCHTLGKSGALRFPDLQGVATRAAAREPGLTALDYLAQSLYEPNAYIVEGFNPGMPPVNKPPVGLTDDEILAVLAYLQTLGGEATVTMETKLVYTGGTLGGEVAPAAAEGAEAAAEATPAAAADPLAARGCTSSCHQGSEGPVLAGIGARRDRNQLTLAIAGHPPAPGLDQVTLGEAQGLVDYLSRDAGTQGGEG